MKKLPLVMLFLLSCGLFPNIQSSGQISPPTQIRQSDPEGIPTQPDQGAANSIGAVMYRDDFSNPGSGWGSLDVAEGSAGYHTGRYVIQIDHEQIDLFADLAIQFSGGIAVQVSAIKLAGSDDNNFGIICRYQDPSNYYSFVISSDGYAAAFILKDGITDILGSDGWLESDSIHTGDVSNTIRVECVGNSFRLYANGSLLLTVQDNTFADGAVGLIAGTFSEPGTIIAFDDFVVYTAE